MNHAITSKFTTTLSVFQEVDPLVQEIPGGAVELVDLEQVVFRIESLSKKAISEAFDHTIRVVPFVIYFKISMLRESLSV